MHLIVTDNYELDLSAMRKRVHKWLPEVGAVDSVRKRRGVTTHIAMSAPHVFNSKLFSVIRGVTSDTDVLHAILDNFDMPLVEWVIKYGIYYSHTDAGVSFPSRSNDRNGEVIAERRALAITVAQIAYTLEARLNRGINVNQKGLIHRVIPMSVTPGDKSLPIHHYYHIILSLHKLIAALLYGPFGSGMMVNDAKKAVALLTFDLKKSGNNGKLDTGIARSLKNAVDAFYRGFMGYGSSTHRPEHYYGVAGDCPIEAVYRDNGIQNILIPLHVTKTLHSVQNAKLSYNLESYKVIQSCL